MRTPRRSLAVIAAAALVLITAQATLAGNPFAKSTTTAGGYHTWDSDLIDIENVDQTGAGVYVAVLDTGLTSNWTDYFPKARVRADLGVGFEQPVNFKAAVDGKNPCGVEVEKGQLRKTTYIGSRGSTHGTHVASTIIGYSYRANADLAGGFALPAIQVRGIAPNATIIPVKVLSDYQMPALPKCPDPLLQKQGLVVFGTNEMVAAGIDYVTDLKEGVLKGKPVVINMSLGGAPNEEISAVEMAAINRAIAAGIIVVAAASNDGELGMSAPGSYPPVISAGSVGWTGEWLDDGASGNPPANGARYRMWWLQNVRGSGTGTAGNLSALYAGSGDTVEGTAVVDDVYVSDFSSRERQDVHEQDLDVLAPGSWVRGPYPGDGNYAHLPWWSRGIGDLVGGNPGNFYYVGGTSMAAPHVASLAALMLQANKTLVQADVESILEATALAIPAGSRQVWDSGASGWTFYTYSWGDDATGAGQISAPAAVEAARTYVAP
jgi:hypothetical protein